MVLTMLILVGQLHMQLLVLLLCMIIRAPSMEVSSSLHMFPAISASAMRNAFIFVFGLLGEEFTSGMGKKVFVGRLPQEATTDDLRQYFGRFGQILDVYIPKV